MDEVERLLRRLALNDEDSVARVLAAPTGRGVTTTLSPKLNVLVQLGALLALGAATRSMRAAVERAIEAGATEAEILDVLISAAPAMGMARVVMAAPRLAKAMGYDLGADE